MSHSQSKKQNLSTSKYENASKTLQKSPNTKEPSEAKSDSKHKPTEIKNKNESSSKGFSNVLCCCCVEDDDLLLLPVNNDSALNRLVGQLQPGEVLSSVPVRKLPLTANPTAQDNEKNKSRSKGLKPTGLKTQKDSDVTTSSGTFKSMDLEVPSTSNGRSRQFPDNVNIQTDLLQDLLDQSRFHVNDPCCSFQVCFSGQMMGSGYSTQYKVLTMSMRLTEPLVMSSQLTASGSNLQGVAHTAPSDMRRPAITGEYGEEDDDIVQ
ncbi:uncharacterized protein LOC127438904 [Myxocyprinus asiaticus]|uniref:uncharacterized protein LOC127438904 n=1 Tax=Myxocyprinus asiaticus TaxID=70543 RepID=UPI0022218B4D|nr:uncharacterized protein LOC127438904 [Myxocyprinus asiaticus]